MINQSCELTLQAWYLDDGTIAGDTLMVTKALDIIRIDGLTRGLFLNVDKTKTFWSMKDPKVRAEGVFPISSLCLISNVHRMDQWENHAVHCSSEVGVKFRHNLVRDILVDICSKTTIMVRKEAPMAFLSEDGKDLRPADLLLLNWLQGPWGSLAQCCGKRKYASKCADNGYKFIPFAFSTFGEFDKDALDTLSRIKSFPISHSNNVKSGAFIFH
uniref:Pentatricopeptide repeat (PPR) superfamily protein n=1 Tax=Tanacetum cinerariifolium TaxID=118510 RepID=A0A6L2M640_TANCI|nr:pentatricopeptide repeat (PPR) superfamily protein [Tanacetum cinerariifolium]